MLQQQAPVWLIWPVPGGKSNFSESSFTYNICPEKDFVDKIFSKLHNFDTQAQTPIMDIKNVY